MPWLSFSMTFKNESLRELRSQRRSLLSYREAWEIKLGESELFIFTNVKKKHGEVFFPTQVRCDAYYCCSANYCYFGSD